MKVILPVIVLLMCLTQQAFATGGFSCEVDDQNLQLNVESALGRIAGAPILNLQAHALVKLAATPNDMKELDLNTHLAQRWINHPDFRLQFYLEREGETPHGTFELVLVTTASDDEGTYSGDYHMTVFYTEPPADATLGNTLKATGKVSCFVE